MIYTLRPPNGSAGSKVGIENGGLGAVGHVTTAVCATCHARMSVAKIESSRWPSPQIASPEVPGAV